ncbi:hypothetical protein [Chroococcidiopsis sp. TS-821]|uniref:hypothetical protein n=1 Tax=Chroococcidiopsis sp. TS-821 TaxID=1378066 RepID=UPI000D476AEA|nr:hypothetical protein [Chroococcidiopsis sp. TS-821]PPS42366.1 hypothetical protein B1A85_15200 [Chroococcidiopsis sp. TS-821]
MQIDNGSFHKSASVLFPANVIPIFQVVHSSELNPIELWQHLKQALAWDSCKTLHESRREPDKVLKSITVDVVSSLGG